jgi:hypothetical protein
MSREDGQQPLQGIQPHFPPGSQVCSPGSRWVGNSRPTKAPAGPGSLIGETTVSVGLGGNPFAVKGGRVYITGPYKGAPFGLSIVTPTKAGPFDLEHDTSNPNQQSPCDCLVVRAKVEIDPHTAVLSATTDPIPHILDGVLLEIKQVNVTVDRAAFTFNPTNCAPMGITGTVESAEGASAPVSTPFQVDNCALLKFAPKFSVSTSGKTSKQNGASLVAKLSYPSGSLGTQANIKSVKVALPKALPSRLTTLQKACTAAQFDSNPAGCPSASLIGHAIVHTQLLPVPLVGPAYFVSHGNEEFPSLIIVMQGYGVTIDLVGSTFISKSGITSSTFKTVPDHPSPASNSPSPRAPTPHSPPTPTYARSPAPSPSTRPSPARPTAAPSACASPSSTRHPPA